jgi:hypothetical protein
MKKIAFAILALMLLAGGASAYLINADCPDVVYIGQDLVLHGTSTLPAGFSTDVILYKNKPAIREIARKTITIQEGGSWTVTFQTSSLAAGEYNLQILEKDGYTYGTYSSCTSKYPKIFQIVDRAQELEITSPLVQSYTGELLITGRSTTVGDSGIRITVTMGSAIIFGPEYVATDKNGAFTLEVPISSSGSYEVNFADNTGSIVTYTFTVQPSTTATTPAGNGLSASSAASAASPAYFAIDAKPGTVTVTLSTGTDWALEYRDETGQITKIDSSGAQNTETAQITSQGGVIYLKVYPAASGTGGTVTVTVANAYAVTVSQTAAGLFGNGATATQTQESPVSLFAAVAALCLIVTAGRRQ